MGQEIRTCWVIVDITDVFTVEDLVCERVADHLHIREGLKVWMNAKVMVAVPMTDGNMCNRFVRNTANFVDNAG